MVRVKICCISSLEEADLAVRAGASALGLVSEMPSGPGVIDDATIAAIARRVPPGVASFLLTSARDPARIIDQQRRARVDTLQLVDHLPRAVHRELRAALPGIRLVQVIHVTGPESVDEAREAAAEVDAILLDSGNPNLAVKELGGTGRVHDWTLSRRIRDSIPVPLYLAGGLHAGNIAEAVRAVRPFGVDLCSGVRTDRKLDGGKLRAFFDGVRAAVST
ncbi:MAG: phosphoribosylanthranilate isomerase [Polyangiaceae bacterium]|nr:phosphoribosylanthranilate isomerase [Polyangiaceae bacterium]